MHRERRTAYSSRSSCIALLLMLALALCHRSSSVEGSAIPMWEFLSRNEKMSHLYRIYNAQVARYCADSEMPDCNKNLLVSGIRNLANMGDNLLDQLDPYQRNAKELIWRAIIGTGAYSPRFDRNKDDSYLAKETDDPLATSVSENNGLAEESVASKDYVEPSATGGGPYLVGPMVIRVFPDGRPVPEDSKRPLPKDEDIEEFRVSRIPSIEDLEANPETSFYYAPRKPSDRGVPSQRFMAPYPGNREKLGFQGERRALSENAIRRYQQHQQQQQHQQTQNLRFRDTYLKGRTVASYY